MRIFLRFVLAGFCGLWLHGAWACAICAPDDAQGTVANRLRAAQRIVLAQVHADGKQADVRTTVLGPKQQGVVSIAGWQPGMPAVPGKSAGDLLVLVLHAGAPDWMAMGYLPATRAAWLTAVATSPRLEAGGFASRERMALFLRDLEDSSPIVAQVAYDEIASQPYAVLRANSAALAASRIAGWLQDPALRPRYPLYYLLLGLAGTAEDAGIVDAALARPDALRSAKELSAMLAALVALRGDRGLAWMEQRYLQNAELADDEVQAALLALSVHGSDGARVTQEQVVAAYRRFIAANPHRAGFVASDLASWGRWEFAESLADALRSKRQQVFASRYAIVFYLLRNPRPHAKALVEALRAEKLL